MLPDGSMEHYGERVVARRGVPGEGTPRLASGSPRCTRVHDLGLASGSASVKYTDLGLASGSASISYI